MAYRDDLTISVTDLSLSFAASTSAITMSKEKMFECDGQTLIFVTGNIILKCWKTLSMLSPLGNKQSVFSM
jgi:hypothetical protein